MEKSVMIGVIVVVIILVAGGYFLFFQGSSEEQQRNSKSQENSGATGEQQEEIVETQIIGDCKDTDGGRDFFVGGYCIDLASCNNEGACKDICLPEGSKDLSGKPVNLRERVCNNIDGKNYNCWATEFNCPKGCELNDKGNARCISNISCEEFCEERECGDDGCGGNCGTCKKGETCNIGICESICTPDCTGKLCGDDGCGGNCGHCSFKESCIKGGSCVEGNVCEDYDGGKDYFSSSYVSYSSSRNYEIISKDECFIDGSGKLVEKSCTTDNHLRSDVFQCPNGCENGACI